MISFHAWQAVSHIEPTALKTLEQLAPKVLCVHIAGAGLEAIVKQLLGQEQGFSGDAKPSDADSSASLQLQAAFISSMAGIAADVVLEKPALENTSKGSQDQSGHLMSLLISAGGMLHAKQLSNGHVRLPQKDTGGGSLSSQEQAADGNGLHSSTQEGVEDSSHADDCVQSAIQHCLQVRL